MTGKSHETAYRVAFRGKDSLKRQRRAWSFFWRAVLIWLGVVAVVAGVWAVWQ